MKIPARHQLESEMPCLACGQGQENRPMIFKGKSFCSDNCRKRIELLERSRSTR